MARFTQAVALAALTLSFYRSHAQEAACTGAPLTGLVRDSTLALVPGAAITLDGHTTTASGPDGRFRFACVPNGPHELTTKVEGFSTLSLKLSTPHSKDLDLRLQAGTEVSITVESDTNDDAQGIGPGSTHGVTLEAKQLQTLADDPDDLLQELQQLAAATGGGNPANTTISVDGFQGSSSLPPKSSIAYIEVNPDQFSAEYREPPFDGGRVEVYTKPGQKAFHGALFATNGSAWENARDPFSTSSSPLGKQRYGFELTGPIRKQGSDFFLALEHRSIRNDAVVDATSVDASGTQTAVLQTAPAAQHRWDGNARIDWQLGPKNTFIASVDTFNNDQQNVGVGGSSTIDTGYEKRTYDTEIHLTDVTTISPKIMHEVRLGVQLDGFSDTPNSTAPQVSIAGAITMGGSSLGAARENEVWVTIIDDAIIQAGNHLIKVGIQPEYVHLQQYFPTSFNGTYTFGGGVTSTGATITGIQQYVNALNGNFNGTVAGSPTAYNNVTGNPDLTVFQFRNALFFQDDWKVLPNLHFAYGLRYYTQTNPTFAAALQPRFGLSWSPDKKATWNLHAHAGTFAGRYGAHGWAQIVFANGIDRSDNQVYTPTCSGKFQPDPTQPDACQPLTSGTVIHTVRSVQSSLPELYWASENLGFTKTFPHGFTLSADYNLVQLWHDARSENINSPTDNQPTGPRPLAPNLNILQMQASGRGYGNIEFFGLSNQALKRLQFFAGAVRVDIIDDTDDNQYFSPQTTGINAGEYARRDTQGLWQVFGNATLNLPARLVLSANYNGTGLQPFNVTTGFDNNGDGNFNDRPQYAPAGTPLCSANPNATPCGYNTPWGELTTSGGIGSLPRNKGTMPWTFYLDTNLQRTFKLTHNAPDEHSPNHPQTLSLNLRSSNVLNHRNVTSVGTVLGSPQFAQPYAADPGRRIELGARYSF
jgi:hypothetical protein